MNLKNISYNPDRNRRRTLKITSGCALIPLRPHYHLKPSSLHLWWCWAWTATRATSCPTTPSRWTSREHHSLSVGSGDSCEIADGWHCCWEAICLAEGWCACSQQHQDSELVCREYDFFLGLRRYGPPGHFTALPWGTLCGAWLCKMLTDPHNMKQSLVNTILEVFTNILRVDIIWDCTRFMSHLEEVVVADGDFIC